MKRLGIFYFSGTGNTELAAELVARSFTAMGWQTDLLRMEDILNGKKAPDIEQYDMLALGAQVIAYSLPLLVRSFAKKLPASRDGKKVFIFRTSGGVAPVNYNASKSLIRILERKNYDVCYEELFSIGSNWIVKFDDAVMRQLYQATARKITQMCEAVVRGERHFYKTGLWLRFRTAAIGSSATLLLPLLGKDAVVEDSCAQCGLCAKSCPTKNITIQDGKVKFHASCTACLRCYYSCPKKALHLRNFRFLTIPEGYDVKKSLSEEGYPNEKPNGRIPPFFSGYIEG